MTMEITGSSNDSDQSIHWKQYYDNAEDLSFEVNSMHEEGEKLSKIVAKAYPTDTREYWSYRDVQQAVEISRFAWESKQRVGKGRPQRWFHSLIMKFHMHATLFSIFPAGNTYASIVAGAVMMLVKASVNHTQTIAALSDALDSITDAIALCDIDFQLIRSRPVRDSIAKLYKEVFKFFIEAADWYQSSSLTKIRNSFHRDFAEQFKDSVSTIILKASAVRHAAQFGSQAEVRVTRLGVESLQKSFDGTRDEFQSIAVRLETQHNETLKHHLTTQELLSSLNQLRYGADQISAQVSHINSHAPSQDNVSPPLPYLTAREGAERLKTFAGYQDNDLERTTQPITPRALLPYQVAATINQWLANPEPSLLYLEQQGALAQARADAVLVTHVIRLSGFQAASYAPSRRLTCPEVVEQPSHGAVPEMAIGIASSILQSLPDDHLLRGPIWELIANQPPAHSLSNSYLEILADTLRTPSGTFHVILAPNPEAFLDADSHEVSQMVSIIRSAALHETSSLRVLILTQQKIPSLVSHLSENEVKIVINSSGAKKALTPIVMPNPE